MKTDHIDFSDEWETLYNKAAKERDELKAANKELVEALELAKVALNYSSPNAFVGYPEPEERHKKALETAKLLLKKHKS